MYTNYGYNIIIHLYPKIREHMMAKSEPLTVGIPVFKFCYVLVKFITTFELIYIKNNLLNMLLKRLTYHRNSYLCTKVMKLIFFGQKRSIGRGAWNIFCASVSSCRWHFFQTMSQAWQISWQLTSRMFRPHIKPWLSYKTLIVM